MKAIKTAPAKKLTKEDREHLVLMALIESYLLEGKPVGSNTLKEAYFQDLSSATIRNYFAHLEQQGFLHQQHASGGRTPTHKAYRIYAQENLNCDQIEPHLEEKMKEIRHAETKEIAGFLQKNTEKLSTITGMAPFISAPRFDHDYINDIKLVPIDANRCICILISDFGVIQTEILYVDTNDFSTENIEKYFQWRLSASPRPENLSTEEEELASTFYNELLIRYIVGYTNFIDEEVYRTGFSNLLKYPEFQESSPLASTLALFENAHSMRLLLRECSSKDSLQCWIGDDLATYAPQSPDCAIIAAPYHIGNQSVAAIGLLGPVRMPYKELCATLRHFSESLSEALTRNIHKFKISYRQPTGGNPENTKEEHRIVGHTHLMLIEDNRSPEHE